MQANVFPFTFNVTLAVPVPFAVTLPLAFTTATFVLLLDQVIPLLWSGHFKRAGPAFGKNHGYPVHRKSRMVVVVYVLSAFS